MNSFNVSSATNSLSKSVSFNWKINLQWDSCRSYWSLEHLLQTTVLQSTVSKAMSSEFKIVFRIISISNFRKLSLFWSCSSFISMFSCSGWSFVYQRLLCCYQELCCSSSCKSRQSFFAFFVSCFDHNRAKFYQWKMQPNSDCPSLHTVAGISRKKQVVVLWQLRCTKRCGKIQWRWKF